VAVAVREAVTEAIRRKLFGRALKATVTVDPDLADRVSALLKKDCLSTLSLASKAGEAVAGFDKVSAALDRGRVRVLVAASDGSRMAAASLPRACAIPALMQNWLNPLPLPIWIWHSGVQM
jgi:hypothetical protein